MIFPPKSVSKTADLSMNNICIILQMRFWISTWMYSLQCFLCYHTREIQYRWYMCHVLIYDEALHDFLSILEGKRGNFSTFIHCVVFLCTLTARKQNVTSFILFETYSSYIYAQHSMGLQPFTGKWFQTLEVCITSYTLPYLNVSKMMHYHKTY